MKILVGYVPVVHRGYVELFRRNAGAAVLVLGESIVSGFTQVARDMRAITPLEAVRMIRSLSVARRVAVVEMDGLKKLSSRVEVVMPDEELSRAVAGQFFLDHSVQFQSVFLRWDKTAMMRVSKVNPDHQVSFEQFHLDMLGIAYGEAKRSSDWWRQVGALAVREGRVLFSAHNAHMPSEHTPYVVGDPRSSFEAGERIDLSSAIHGEIAIIARCARLGVSLEGADLYVTTFPCTGCARAIAQAGFRRVFYAEGYSQIEGEETLRSRNIEIIRVEMTQPPP